jgi:hypothetical protein
MTLYRMTEIFEVEADSADGAWTALGNGMADRIDGWYEVVCATCGACDCPWHLILDDVHLSTDVTRSNAANTPPWPDRNSEIKPTE